MAAFVGDIAFLLGIVVAASGLLTWHCAAADPRPKLLKIAGIVLLVAGIGTAICTAFYYLKYHLAGDLEYPYPVMMGGKMMEKMMDRRMENKQSSTDIPEGIKPMAPPDATKEEHEAHHAD